MSGANAPHGNDKMIINALQLSGAMHVYEVQSRKDKRGVDLISDVLPFCRLRYDGPNATTNAIRYEKIHRRDSHHTLICVCDAYHSVIQTHHLGGEFNEAAGSVL